MKKIIVLFCLYFLFAEVVFSQSASDSVCRASMEKIFKALALKTKHEAVEYFYTRYLDINRFKTVTDADKRKIDCRRDFEWFTGLLLDLEIQKDSVGISEKITMDDFLKLLYYPTQKAWQEYRRFLWREYVDNIQHIKSEKEICLKCIDAEFAKNELSEYAHKTVQYDFRSPLSSFALPGLAKLDYIEIFKEFILNSNKEILPEYTSAIVYLTGISHSYSPER